MGLSTIFSPLFGLFCQKMAVLGRNFALNFFDEKFIEIFNFDQICMKFGIRYRFMVLQKWSMVIFEILIFYQFFWTRKSKKGHFWPFFQFYSSTHTKKSHKKAEIQKSPWIIFEEPYKDVLCRNMGQFVQNWKFAYILPKI